MNLVWEVELDIWRLAQESAPTTLHTLKQLVDKPNDLLSPYYKIAGAYVVKRGERKWEAFFPGGLAHNDKTFRSLKAAKAYAVAIITLEN